MELQIRTHAPNPAVLQRQLSHSKNKQWSAYQLASTADGRRALEGAEWMSIAYAGLPARSMTRLYTLNWTVVEQVIAPRLVSTELVNV